MNFTYMAHQCGRSSQPELCVLRGARCPFARQRITVVRPPEDIVKLNAWMKSYAAQVNATYVDYFSALVDAQGWMKDGIANDGLHPNAEGYKIMAPIVSAAIDRVLN